MGRGNYLVKLPKKLHSNHREVRLDGLTHYEYDYVNWGFEDESYKNGISNPHWRENIKRHQQAGTPFQAHRHRYDFRPYNVEQVYNYSWKTTPDLRWTYLFANSGNYVSSIPPFAISHHPSEAKANNEAITNYVKKAIDAQRVFFSGETIGEFRELVRQVKNPGLALRKGLGAYVETVKKRTQRTSVRRLPRNRRADVQAGLIRDAWLEYQFGWRPLVSEISNVIDYVNETDPFSRLDTNNIQGVGKAEDSGWPNGDSGHYALHGTRPSYEVRWRETVKVTVIYRGQVGMGNSAAGYLARKTGFQPRDWIPTAWELLPFSFLIDYFTNIGDLITALNFNRSDLKWTMKTVLYDHYTESVDCRPLWRQPESGSHPSADWTSTKKVLSLPHAKHRYTGVNRTPFYGSVVPRSEVSIPGAGTKWINMAALLVGSAAVQKLLK